MKKNYYAVREGKKAGIYSTWAECEAQVKGYAGAKYKKFTSEEEALNFMADFEKTGEKNIEEIGADEGVAYVDGSFHLESFTYSYGVVFFTREGKETFSGRDDDKDLAEMRNVSGELKGAMEAMKIALEMGVKRLYLHYDYMGIEEWALGKWKTNKEGTKAYKKFYDSIVDDLEVKFIKIKAHSGNKYNEEADKLAKEAL